MALLSWVGPTTHWVDPTHSYLDFDASWLPELVRPKVATPTEYIVAVSCASFFYMCMRYQEEEGRPARSRASTAGRRTGQGGQAQGNGGGSHISAWEDGATRKN